MCFLAGDKWAGKNRFAGVLSLSICNYDLLEEFASDDVRNVKQR